MNKTRYAVGILNRFHENFIIVKLRKFSENQALDSISVQITSVQVPKRDKLHDKMTCFD